MSEDVKSQYAIPRTRTKSSLSSESEREERKKRVKELLRNGKESVERITKLAENNSKEQSSRSEGSGLKIMTTNHLLTRLPILLSQKQAGNNS